MSNTGSPLSGIIVTLGGSQTGTTTTNASGNYTLSGVPAGGSYTVTPSSLDEAFLPITSAFSNLSANQTVNFIGSPIAGLYFYPVQPCRVADTRPPAGFSGQFGPPSLVGGTTRSFNIQASSCGIPATAVAYSLNFTVVPPSGGPQANLTTWPTGLASGMPNVSTLNYSGSAVANAAIVPAGTNGSINVYVNSGTDLIIDVNGYYALPLSSGGILYAESLSDRRYPRRHGGFTGSFGPPSLLGGAIRPFNIPASSCGVPAAAAAYSLNFAVNLPPPTGPAANLTTWPSSQASMPNVSTLNYSGSALSLMQLSFRRGHSILSTFTLTTRPICYSTSMVTSVHKFPPVCASILSLPAESQTPGLPQDLPDSSVHPRWAREPLGPSSSPRASAAFRPALPPTH